MNDPILRFSGQDFIVTVFKEANPWQHFKTCSQVGYACHGCAVWTNFEYWFDETTNRLLCKKCLVSKLSVDIEDVPLHRVVVGANADGFITLKLLPEVKHDPSKQRNLFGQKVMQEPLFDNATIQLPETSVPPMTERLGSWFTSHYDTSKKKDSDGQS